MNHGTDTRCHTTTNQCGAIHGHILTHFHQGVFVHQHHLGKRAQLRERRQRLIVMADARLSLLCCDSFPALGKVTDGRLNTDRSDRKTDRQVIGRRA